jgi:hypothetical protein
VLRAGSRYSGKLTSGVRGSSHHNGQAKHDGGELGHLVRDSASNKSPSCQI